MSLRLAYYYPRLYINIVVWNKLWNKLSLLPGIPSGFGSGIWAINCRGHVSANLNTRLRDNIYGPSHPIFHVIAKAKGLRSNTIFENTKSTPSGFRNSKLHANNSLYSYATMKYTFSLSLNLVIPLIKHYQTSRSVQALWHLPNTNSHIRKLYRSLMGRYTWDSIEICRTLLYIVIFPRGARLFTAEILTVIPDLSWLHQFGIHTCTSGHHYRHSIESKPHPLYLHASNSTSTTSIRTLEY